MAELVPVRRRNQSRPCQSKGLGRSGSVCISLLWLSLSIGCQSPRTVSLKSLSNPLAAFLPDKKLVTSGAVRESSISKPDDAAIAASDGNANAESKSADENPLRLANHLESQVDSENPVVGEGSAALDKLPLPEPLPLPLPEPRTEAGDVALEKEEELVFFDDVLISVTETFPAIREAALIRNLALGNQTSALGEFDDKLQAHTINQPLGFYENYRHGAGWKKPLLLGGEAYVDYRMGRGTYEPWFRERETNEAGEFSAGFSTPLLQNRAIDPRRTALQLAALDVQRANPELFQQVLAVQYEAALAYWDWIAAAKQYEIALELMRLAEERVDRIETQIKAGDVATIVGIDNRRLLAMRREKLIENRQKLDSTAIKLSLFYRNDQGRPLLPTMESQPKDFPPLPTANVDLDLEIQRAIANRPELAILNIVESQTRAELRLAINQQLPDLAFGTEVSQDIGGQTSSKNDKQPLILEAGLIGSVPVQRRKAIGKAQALRAKLGQIDAKRELTGDKIANEVRQAVTILEAAKLRLEQSRLTRDLARQTLEAGEIAFAAGDIDILLLNIYEQAFADAGSDVINSQAAVLIAESMLLTATGRSLLDSIQLPPPNLP